MLARALLTAKSFGSSSLELFNAQRACNAVQGSWPTSQASQLVDALHRRFSTAVLVPNMGDSITEGSISAVLKQSGDSVLEDEVIAQIETDKVVIDVKAPGAGVLESVLVKEEDVVTPGTPVAYIKAGASSSSPAPADASSPATSPAGNATPSSAPAPSTSRRPGISFPIRMTHDGRRLSEMPAAEAASYLQQYGASATTPAQPATAPSPPPAAPAPTQRAPAVYTTSAPPRRELTAKEMEVIELGGAFP
jgi:2-oxoglutarate dehydrogenase E2 component (dihydrolipoamide succinyltransferase)